MPRSGPELAERIVDPLTAVIASASYGAVEMRELAERAAAGTLTPEEAAAYLKEAATRFSEIAAAGAAIDKLRTSALRAGDSVADAEQTAAEQTAAEEVATKHVLVIDNEPAMLRVVQRMLRGYSVECVSSAQEALALLAGGASYDVIVCDVIMPGMTGLDLYHELAYHYAEAAHRMVFVSAGHADVDATELRRLQPTRFLDKPFQISSLRAAIAQVSQRSA